MNEIEKQSYVQLPNDLISEYDITPQDLLVLLSIKSFCNKKTKICNPSIHTIAKKCNMSINTVQKSIDILLDRKCLCIEKSGRSFNYIFPDYINFEIFSDDFLENEYFSILEKSFLIAVQQFMYKKDNIYGVTSYNNQELSKKLNMSLRSLERAQSSLKSKGILTIAKTKSKDEAGCNRYLKIVDFRKFNEAVVYVLMKHEKDITNMQEDISELKKQQEENKKLIEILIKENKSLKEQLEQKNELIL